jgi:beta-N-acetylhexosaminidase
MTQSLSLAQQAGQRLMIGFDGLELNDELKYGIEEIGVGGIILFARNIVSPDQVTDLCNAAREFAAQTGQPPLLIGIDQEGGVVARLKPPFTQFPGNPSMTSIRDAEQFARTTAEELSRIGVNINMAPVLDVADPDGDSIMANRVFGEDLDWVARMGDAVIRVLQSNGILAVGKHFPGIGRTVLDSHEDLPDLDIDLERLLASDLIPFKSAIDNGVTAIMLSHIRYSGLDPLWPASLSVAIARDLLRGRLAFDGLVLTDDIDMGALAKHYDTATIVTQCLAAEVDMILICHSGPNIKAAWEHVRQQINASPEAARAGQKSLERIMRAKQYVA